MKKAFVLFLAVVVIVSCSALAKVRRAPAKKLAVQTVEGTGEVSKAGLVVDGVVLMGLEESKIRSYEGKRVRATGYIIKNHPFRLEKRPDKSKPQKQGFDMPIMEKIKSIKVIENRPAPGPVGGDQLINSDRLSTHWDNLLISAAGLPGNSWYRIGKTGPDEYELIIIPNVGKQEFQSPTDFKISVNIRRTNRPAGQEIRISPVGYKDLREEVFQTGEYDITLKHLLHYSYRGPKYSNPNPYTPEVKEIILRVWQSIRVERAKA